MAGGLQPRPAVNVEPRSWLDAKKLHGCTFFWGNSTMSNKTTASGFGAIEDAKTAARDLTQRVKDSAGDAASALGDSRSKAADGLDSAASALHERAGDLPGGSTVRDFARSTADRLSSSADYMRTHDSKRMMADTQSFVKNNPGPALMVAAAFGFLLGRAFSRD